MEFGLASYAFALLAGVLSTLSPCVLPIIPILLGSAANAHRRAPLALAAGLALSYSMIGTTLASAGSALGMDAGVFRTVGAIILGMLGIVLLSANLQQRFALATSGIGNAGNTFISKMRLDGLLGQFAIGLVLGVVWSTCVGPTLGSAIVLASEGRHLAEVALVMAVFGVGAALPVVVLGYLSRTAMMKVRGKLMQAGRTGKIVLGASMLLIAILIVSGADRRVEAWLVDHSPAWLTTLTTHF